MDNKLLLFLICVSSNVVTEIGGVKEHTKACHCEPKDTEKTTWLECSDVDQYFRITEKDTANCSHYKPNHLVIIDSDIPTLTAEFFGIIAFDQFNVVSFSSCGIRNITANAFSNFTRLKSLILEDNELTENTLTESLKSITNLKIKTLNLDRNNFTIIKNETFLSLGSHITSLQLSDCGIEYIETDFLRWLPNLKKISLNNNALHEMNFLAIQNDKCRLHDVQIMYNSISNLDLFQRESTKPCIQSIESLSLTGNPVASLAPVNSLRNLRLLYAQSIPCNVKSKFPVFNASLTVLYLDGSNFSCWRKDMFSRLKKFEFLSLKGTNFAHAPLNFTIQLFSELNVETLILKNAGLRIIPDHMFRNITSLKNLDLSDNSISSWSTNAFSGPQLLVSVSLNNNNISVIAKNSLPSVNHSLDLSNNPFLCSCVLVDFRLYFEHHKDILMREPVGTYKCAKPLRLKDMDLQSFRPEYTDCNPFNPYVIVAFCTCASLIFITIVVNVISACRERNATTIHMIRTLRRNVYHSLDENTSHEY
ncbi:hypothetical protein FSP39_006767 [Pinctada imbricata]|uniref:LRRCT domain-containing protein n=1 Tax=Pinctada imbricata TaxID=66713 RepID=A0AA89BQN5_PINIB|nr:hypothetical protein FSP39_006767 [Pinctada imbricata]